MVLTRTRMRRRGIWSDESGQDLIEYALLTALIAIVALSAVTAVGATIRDVFWSVIAASLP